MSQAKHIQQRIKEAQGTWDTLTKRIEAVKRDLVLELDGQKTVVLKERLSALEDDRRGLEDDMQALRQCLDSASIDGEAAHTVEEATVASHATISDHLPHDGFEGNYGLQDLPAGIQSDLSSLFRKLTEGQVILFVGPGTRESCVSTDGGGIPSDPELALLIKARFFPDEEVPTDLQTVCACAEAEESRRILNRFIYDVLIDYRPSETLKMIPRVRWRRIYTTNFDHLLEQAYAQVSENVQNLCPIYSDRDIQSFRLGQDVPYFKLRGCITQLSSQGVKLILTTEDHASHREHRKRLLQRLQDDLFDHTILFVGYDLASPSFQALFYEVQDEMDIRDFPRCYAVSPNLPRVMVNVNMRP